MVYSKAREGQSPTEIHEWSLMNFTEFVVNCAQTSWMNSMHTQCIIDVLLKPPNSLFFLENGQFFFKVGMQRK